MDYKERDGLLTLIFYLLVLITFISYFIWHKTYPAVFITVGIVAIVLRVITYILRFLKR
ncbi:hypothetical protein [Porphyromonas pogonae]|uniref:hypothetical protein n=1 Tax=Porphyromonas pogonae TaxID=867595 RepID=UPI002E76617B|nr:hypothetical protein [Porphyromonas pogonae]